LTHRDPRWFAALTGEQPRTGANLSEARWDGQILTIGPSKFKWVWTSHGLCRIKGARPSVPSPLAGYALAKP
jgi:hypothetical protein